MKHLIFATNNRHKIEEATAILHGQYHIVSLKEKGFFEEIPETSTTLEGNASQKAWHIHDRFGEDCFADDTGLEVEALGGEPGVYSARYAGDECDFNKNVDKLLDVMKGQQNRKARFRTVVSLIIAGKETLFEGIIEGRIIEERRGLEGFGYDPVFIPSGQELTFSQMSADLKNKISHRALAMQKMADYLAV